MTDIKDFAILAPVPLEHLRSGEVIAGQTGFIAFGSCNWELFRQVEEQRGATPVPTLIYPSHEDVTTRVSFIVCWAGCYVGCEERANGRHSQ